MPGRPPREAGRHDSDDARGPAISGASSAPSIDPASHPQPSTFDRPAHNVSGTAVSDRDPPIRDFFPKSWKVFSDGINANSVMRVPLQTRLLEHSGPTR